MSSHTTADLVRLARREGMQEAAKIVERMSDTLMRQANRAHDSFPDNRDGYDRFEALEYEASLLSSAAARIMRASKRKPRP